MGVSLPLKGTSFGRFLQNILPASFVIGEEIMAIHSVQETFEHGLEYLKRNRIQEASNAFRKAIKTDPDNPQFLSYYGLILALGEQNFQDAINFCRAAILKT